MRQNARGRAGGRPRRYPFPSPGRPVQPAAPPARPQSPHAPGESPADAAKFGVRRPAASDLRRAILGATWLSLSGYLVYVLNFGTNIILARLLFPKDFGTFALAVSSVELLSILSGFSFSQAIIQMEDEPEIADTAFVLTVGTAVALLVLGAVTTAALRVYHLDFSVLFFSIFVVRVFALFSFLQSARLERELHYTSLSSIRLVAAVLGAGVAIWMAMRGTGVWSLFDREMATTFVTLVGLAAVTRWLPRWRYDAVSGRRLLIFGWQMFMGRTLESIWYRGGSFLLGVFGGVTELGYYDRARYLGELGHNILAFGAVQVAFPVYARLQRDFERLSEAYRLTHFFLIRLMFPMLLWLAMFPREILGLLLGPRWLPAVPILQVLALYAFLMPIIDNIKVLLTGIGRLREAVWVRVWQATVTLALLPVGIPKWGAAGAAGAATLGNVAALIAGYRYLAPSVRTLALGSYARPALATLIAAAGVKAAYHVHLITGTGRLVQAGYLAIAGIVYCVALVLIDGGELRKHINVVMRGLRKEDARE